MQSMLTIKKSELLKIRTAFCQCRFPALTPHAIRMRRKHREDPEFRAKMVAHNRKISKNKRYSPEKYEKMIVLGAKLGSCPESIAKKKRTAKERHIIRKPSTGKRLYDTKLHDRPNDYAGVVTMSDYASL